MIALLQLKPQPPEKLIGCYYFIEALDKSGCAICRCADESARSNLDSLLYESVTDPIIRGELRMTMGFCNLHGRMAMATGNAHALSILYEDLVAYRLAALTRHEMPPSENSARCLVCQLAEETERDTLSICREFFDDPQFRAALQNADAFCARHFSRLLDHLPKGEAHEWLWQWELAKLVQLRHQLAEFIRKDDYHLPHEKVRVKEATVWQLAMEWFVGKLRLPAV